MKADTYEHSGRFHRLFCLVAEALQLAQLVVGCDTERLESSGCGVYMAPLARYGRGDEIRQLNRARKFLCLPPVNNPSGKAAREAFFAVFPEDSGQFFLLLIIHYVGGRRFLGGVHSHVDLPVMPQTEASLRPVELER